MNAILGTFVNLKTMAELISRFNEKWTENKISGCHIWSACLTPKGYGAIQVNRKKMGAHRVSWMIHFGAIPDGIYVCHKCDNPKCVNPKHLFLGTPKDNADDMQNKGRKFIPAKEKNAMYKINENTRMMIIHDYQGFDLTAKQIAIKYEISVGSVMNICSQVKRGKKGARNPNAKVTKEIATNILAMRKSGHLIKDICAEVGLCWPTVRSVINCESFV